MGQELKSLVKKILANSSELEKLYPYFSNYIDDDTDYYYKKLSDISPEFNNLDLDTQAEIITFCFYSGFKMVNQLINSIEDITDIKDLKSVFA